MVVMVNYLIYQRQVVNLQQVKEVKEVKREPLLVEEVTPGLPVVEEEVQEVLPKTLVVLVHHGPEFQIKEVEMGELVKRCLVVTQEYPMFLELLDQLLADGLLVEVEEVVLPMDRVV